MGFVGGVLEADIYKYMAAVARFTKEIATHKVDISVWTSHQASPKVRGMEKADYDATHNDYPESITAWERTIAVPKKQAPIS